MGAENAAVLLSLIDGLATVVIGPQAAMNEFEQALIQEPLERILGRIEWEIGEQINRWTDPVMLAIGLFVWGSRLYDLAKEKQELAKPVTYKEDPALHTKEETQSDGRAPKDFTLGEHDKVDLPMRTDQVTIRHEVI